MSLSLLGRGNFTIVKVPSKLPITRSEVILSWFITLRCPKENRTVSKIRCEIQCVGYLNLDTF